MANLVLTGGENQFSWQITGLGSPFNTSNYKAAGISTSAVASGASYVNGVVSTTNATSYGSQYSVSGSVSYYAGTYTFYGWCQAANGLYYPAGSGTVTVTAPPPKLNATSTATSVTVTASDGYYDFYKYSIYTSSPWQLVEQDSYYEYGKTSRIFYNLQPNTNYIVYCSYGGNGNSAAGTVSATVSTQSVSLPTLFTSSTSTSITVNITNTGGFQYFKFSIQYNGVEVGADNIYSTATSRTFTGLTPNTSYTIWCGCSLDGQYQYSNYIVSKTASTSAAKAPTFSITKTATSITISVASAGDYKYFKYSLHDYQEEPLFADEYYSYDTQRTYTNLVPNSKYIVYYAYSWDGYSAVQTLRQEVITDKPIVSPWNWNVSNGSATATQTSKAYAAITSKGETSDFSYLVWNDMCKKVRDVRAAADLWVWDINYLPYESTCMSSSDKVLTAARFNSLKYNIGSQYSTGIDDVSTGDPVLGSYFIDLMAALNAWINKIS